MSELDFLLADLPVVEPVGLDSVSDEFVEIAQFVDQEDYKAAALKIKLQFDRDRYDIRLIGYFLYNEFSLLGPGSLNIIGAIFLSCQTKNKAAIGPEQRKAKYFNSTLAWFANTVSDQLSYHKSVDSSKWSEWLESFPSELVQETVKTYSELVQALPIADYKSSANAISRLLSFARELDRELSVIPKPSEEETSVSNSKLEHPEPVDSYVPRVSSGKTLLPGRVELEVSVQFMSLCEKLNAFEKVIERGDHKKAAMISNDVLAELEKFDPREHFPKLFSNFYSALTENVALIQPHWEQRDSLEWQMREQLYKVDLPSFIKG